MSNKATFAVLLSAAAIACIGEAAPPENRVVEVRIAETWRHRETGESAVMLNSGEYGCLERATRRHILAPDGGRWLLEIWEAPREGYSRQRLVDDISGWSVEVEDREPPWPKFTGPVDFTRSWFWERVGRGEYSVERTVRIADGGEAAFRYEMVEGSPVGTDNPEVRAMLEAARLTASRDQLSRLAVLRELVLDPQGTSMGFSQFSDLLDLVGDLTGQPPGTSAVPSWHIQETAFRSDPAGAAELGELLRAFRHSQDTADPLSGLHVTRVEDCGIAGEDVPGSS